MLQLGRSQSEQMEGTRLPSSRQDLLGHAIHPTRQPRPEHKGIWRHQRWPLPVSFFLMASLELA